MVLREDPLADMGGWDERKEVDDLRRWVVLLPAEASEDWRDELPGAEMMVKNVPACPSDPVPWRREDSLDLGAEEAARAVDVVQGEAWMEGSEVVPARRAANVLDDEQLGLEA